MGEEAGVEGIADQVIRYLVRNGRCNDCHGRYDAEDVYVLDERAQAPDGGREFDLAAVCNQCFTLNLIRAVVQPQDRAVAPRKAWSELTPDERRRFDSLTPLEADDVLDVVSFLDAFDGDFRCLFGREPEEA